MQSTQNLIITKNHIGLQEQCKTIFNNEEQWYNVYLQHDLGM